jgi:hypothetical protein
MKEKRRKENEKKKEKKEGNGRKRMKGGEEGCGRGIRHEKDHRITYILDSNVTWLIKGKVKVNAVPRWFKDALVYNNKNYNKNNNNYLR